jgi:hypothetical protein
MPAPSRTSGWPLPADLFDTKVERSTLIDPGKEDPLDHLRWVPVDRTQAPKAWTWQLKWITPRGQVTAKILGLDRLADEVRDLATGLWSRFAREVLGPRDERTACRAWATLVDACIKSSVPFAAATWSILDAFRSANDRAKRLQLQEPPRP